MPSTSAIDAGAEYFAALVTEFGLRARYVQVLRRCGDNAEADALDETTTASMLKKLESQGYAAPESGRIDTLAGALVAREMARGSWIGYTIGFQRGLSVFWNELESRKRDVICKVAREWARGR